MDLKTIIKSVNVLNINRKESIEPSSDIVFKQDVNDNSYIVSDCDETLLILIEFNCFVNLKSMKIYALNPTDVDMSPPKQIHVYKTNDLNIDFDDLGAMNADVSIQCIRKKLQKGGQNIKLQTKSKNAVKFKNTKYLVIYIESNQQNTENTFLNFISFKGSCDKPLIAQKRQTTQKTQKAQKTQTTQTTQKTQKTQEPKTLETIFVHKPCIDVKQCAHLHPFVDIMSQYQTTNIDSTKVIEALDHYHHLLYQHNNEEEFEFLHQHITQCLGECKSLAKCDKFRRLYRDRNDLKQNDDDQKEKLCLMDEVYLQIMDKLHCHFYHCFDIGYRLHSKHRATLVHDDNKQEYINDERLKSLRILSSRVKDSSILNTNNNAKYNQISFGNNDFLFVEKKQTYSYGYSFIYNPALLKEHKDEIRVESKYDSLKEEVTQNSIIRLAMEQFENECKKATIHHQSFHRKTYYNNGFLKVEGILVLMLYCNYTHFSYEFSKTYRENNGKNHCEFYWMGKGMKDAMYCNWTVVKHGTFYHGVSCKLLFPFKNKGIDVYCPLSTSSVFQVAMNFTENNNGLIVEFQKAHGYDRCRYFPTEWLSDYSNEAECLFLNSERMECIRIADIADPQSGARYDIIFEAQRYMDSILFDIDIESDPSKLTDITKQLITHIIADKKRGKIDAYAKEMVREYFHSKTNVNLGVASDHQVKWVNCEELFNLLFSTSKIINLDLIFSLFPNMEVLKLNFDSWNREVWNHVISYVVKFTSAMESRIKEIWYCKFDNNEQLRMNVANDYTVTLRKQSLFVVAKEDVMNDINIDADSPQNASQRVGSYGGEFTHKVEYRGLMVGLLTYNDDEFVRYLLKAQNKIYFQDVDGSIESLMRKRIKLKPESKRIGREIPQQKRIDALMSYVDVFDQKQFNRLCEGLPELHVYANSLLLKIMHQDDPHSELINLKEVDELFPYLPKITLHDILLNKFIFDDMLQYLKTQNSIMEVMLISKNETKDSAYWISKYRKIYNELDIRVDANKANSAVRILRYGTVNGAGYYNGDIVNFKD